MGNWKFFLANSSDMSLNADITGIARSKQLTLAHNRSGNCTFNLPLSVDTLEYSQTNQKCVIAMKNNNVVWSGPIWSRSIDLNAEKIEVNSVGWFEILMYRFIWESLSSVDFSAGADEGQIAFALQMFQHGLLLVLNLLDQLAKLSMKSGKVLVKKLLTCLIQKMVLIFTLTQ
jgi:hypothetical protein